MCRPTSNGNESGTLKRIDFAGNEQLTYPTEQLGGAGQFSGRYLESPDGTQLVLGTANHGNEILPRSNNSLVVLSNDGNIVRTLPAPMARAVCFTREVVDPDGDPHPLPRASAARQTNCGKCLSTAGHRPRSPRLTRASIANPGFEDDSDNGIAWQDLPSGTFLPPIETCGTLVPLPLDCGRTHHTGDRSRTCRPTCLWPA